MEDVSFGEFVGWLFTSGWFMAPIALAVAWKVTKDHIRSERRIKAARARMGKS